MKNYHVLRPKLIVGSLAGKQQGAVLIVSMIILLAMTIIGTASMNSLTMEERMVSNMRDDNVAFQAAESGLVDCENAIDKSNPLYGDPAKYWKFGDANADMSNVTFWWQDDSLWADSDRAQPYGLGAAAPGSMAGIDPINGGVSDDPVCIREHIGLAPDDLSFDTRAERIGAEMFRVTVKGVGADARTESVVQSTLFSRYK